MRKKRIQKKKMLGDMRVYGEGLWSHLMDNTSGRAK